MKLTVRKVPKRQLSPEQIEATWRCYQRYVDCPRESFVETLLQAEDIYLCYGEAGELAGFEALKIIPVEGVARRCNVIFTFYADIDSRYRGMNVLQRIGVTRYLSLRFRHPLRPIYWMFTASTYTSYLLLPRNFVHYWPHPKSPTPSSASAIINEVMRILDADDWDPDKGVLARNGALRYREGVVADDKSVLDDPDVRFYAARNPGQTGGDSLACLCPLSARNIASALLNMLRRHWRPQNERTRG